jgi:hypothetical protein
MRVLLDTNIFSSYLLPPPRQTGTIYRIVEGVLSGAYTLLIPEELPRELYRNITTKPYLRSRIDAEEAAAFIAALHTIAKILPALQEEIPAVTRDPNDDYLLAHALLAGAGYLVSGDRDLLDLGPIEGLTILHPADFASLLPQH